ncbi:ADP-ribosylglycohydrolase family protein, partial [[Kitasatospora] papulosa]
MTAGRRAPQGSAVTSADAASHLAIRITAEPVAATAGSRDVPGGEAPGGEAPDRRARFEVLQ